MSYKIKEILPFIINRRYHLAALLAMTVGVVFFKLWYRNASASDLSFLLFPTDFLFGLVVGDHDLSHYVLEDLFNLFIGDLYAMGLAWWLALFHYRQCF